MIKLQYIIRANFLMALLNKILHEYKTLLLVCKRKKPLQIIQIINPSNVPGETSFAIRVTRTNCIVYLSAAEIITQGYELKNFSDYHCRLIEKAAQGRLLEFLNLTENKNSLYKIVSKKHDKKNNQFIFTVEGPNKEKILRTGDEIHADKNLLANLDFHDIYEIGYHQGSGSIIRERLDLLLITKK